MHRLARHSTQRQAERGAAVLNQGRILRRRERRVQPHVKLVALRQDTVIRRPRHSRAILHRGAEQPGKLLQVSARAHRMGLHGGWRRRRAQLDMERRLLNDNEHQRGAEKHRGRCHRQQGATHWRVSHAQGRDACRASHDSLRHAALVRTNLQQEPRRARRALQREHRPANPARAQRQDRPQRLHPARPEGGREPAHRFRPCADRGTTRRV